MATPGDRDVDAAGRRVIGPPTVDPQRGGPRKGGPTWDGRGERSRPQSAGALGRRRMAHARAKHNDDPVAPYMGSAIFLHLSKPDYSPTAGCVAIPRPEMDALLRLARPGDAVEIAL